MILPSLKLLLGLLIFLAFLRPVLAQEQYYFKDEFNLERSANTLDPDKWIVYSNKRTTPNRLGCIFDTVNETQGYLKLKQCPLTPQFPYITSKTNPFPGGDFTATVKFKYVDISSQGNGIQFVDKAPGNGEGYTNLFGLGIWEEMAGNPAKPTLHLIFKDESTAKLPANFAFNEFKVERKGEIYQLYLNNVLYFTSPPTPEKVEAIYFGDPSVQSPTYAWNQFWIDYVRVLQTGPFPTQPFLDLPWDYEKSGMTFNEAATSINAFFDHEYPLLSTNLTEPIITQTKLISYRGGVRSEGLDYSSHDGYDYGAKAKTKSGTPLLAPADGEATFMKSCGACGNAILIDHKNGFQTRYYHMSPDNLVTNTPGQKVNVKKRDKIGEVGYTGNVDPEGEPGSHLHFMVIQDKNNDGDFEDNIPDGIVDPFGWQSTEPDPWENYTFNYKGQNRTGNRSYYLFTKQLDNLNATLTSNEAVFNVGKTRLEFPEGATNETLNIKAQSAPNFADNVLNSLGSIINIEAKNPLGQAVTTFLKNFNLRINFSQFDLSRYNLSTLSIYSSQDGKNWTEEPTEIDLNNKIATTSLNHLTYFALMAERKDVIAPTTTPVFEGEKGTGNNFRSGVTVKLNATDNPDGLGVEFTAYSLGNDEWQIYAEPLSFLEEGNYKINFYSIDNDENKEEVKSVEFSIDKTIPEAEVLVDTLDYDLKVKASGNEQVEITKKPSKKPGEYVYTLKDLAGNSLSLEVFELNQKPTDIFKALSVKYNDASSIPLPENNLVVNYVFHPLPLVSSTIKMVTQNFTMKAGTVFNINADIPKNKTTLNIVENNKPRREEKPGVILLKLKTNKGKLEYSY